MALMTVDLSSWSPSARRAFDRVCRDETSAEIVRAKIRQKQLAKFHRDHAPVAQEGIGGQTMVFDPFVWSALRRVANAQPGEDEEVQDWAARKYPEWCKVKHKPTKFQLGYGSTLDTALPSRPGLKFRRVYPTLKK